MKEFSKRLSKSGSITFPAALRREYGLSDGEKFSISVDGEDGTIFLQRTHGSCMFCKSEKELIIFYGRFICSCCVQNMDADVSERRFANAFEGAAAE
ncbi:AbrB/MazE/SpoVT family DNA-binding domain-containing protein [Paenibacillus alvei]|uniref:AbrB/MazE/SpoVT family DNA-binding domain-containing protein n=1 Tax=Paenibacillus alvei TaxID=44250 RepID=A0ABT4H7T5_PAEAL|nr:AbrB/MazE/SpoVT family DNA-binding domain-containing protein [Paenibacillus alvei]EJW16231.1 hypothetical protein PAV_6c03120 [Paenibacillus alvei DSM 29]MCY9544465.1 AbrB/MazE/SpoVT family DNA-binding domain-containing protein [Paenibacillus alvei]MCY9704437.1 AbrB/MazE/SpoVT family DNA-binding domain-containing protein [Paenibacillus alvei]MCY9736174.1 AbrB/MazE/SpoVT family DNA-binding domain-containing protein [Paenibacillus alvei]MCY9757366.1 AbrB/MazE/SpoVT family DNA-binding domain-c